MEILASEIVGGGNDLDTGKIRVDVTTLGDSDLVEHALADVNASRERSRLRRVGKLVVILGAVAAWMWWRALAGHSFFPGFPDLPISSQAFYQRLKARGVIVVPV